MDLVPRPLRRRDRVLLLAVIGFGFLGVLYFGEFWFFSEARRQPVYFALLSFAIFWGITRSLINWYIYFFITPLPTRASQRSYSVDILTTAMPGEPFPMFEETLAAIQKISYPHRTFLLDGGNDRRLFELCAALGVEHVDCSRIEGAKAGKINHCLRHHSHSEIVLVIDPDHRPRADLFDCTLGWFDDSQVGFVQVVQAYYNRDESFVADAAAEETFGFYGPTMMGLSGLGISTAIGANCIFRRAALDSIDGHAVHLAEDALTSMRLHAAGWRSVYVPYRGTSGLVPADLGSFFKQQFKWSTGMFYLLLHEYPKLFRRFNAVAKAHYLFAGTFYLQGLATLLTLFLPIWFLFLQVFAVEFPLDEFAIHLVPYVAGVAMSYLFVQRWYTHTSEQRLPWRSMVLEKATWHVYVMGLISGLLRRRVEYLPTPKGSDRQAMPRLVLPHLTVIGLSASAIAFALLTYARLDDGTLLMMFFAGLNIALLLPVTWIAIFPRYNWRLPHGAS
ncbi:MAG TPA: glycosyltransferase family 2 protein [Polyangiaceae bacterium]|nr:glycosyltransferase family 2 protein [Polyangiaceae bacterium]